MAGQETSGGHWADVSPHARDKNENRGSNWDKDIPKQRDANIRHPDQRWQQSNARCSECDLQQAPDGESPYGGRW